MAAATNTLHVNWRDVAGNVAKFTVLVAAAVLDPGGGAVSAFVTAITAVSKAVSTARTLGFVGAYSDTATQSDYGDNEDKAQMTFSDEDGQIHSWKVPSPKATCFMADGETIDPDDSLVAAYIAAVTSGATTKAGRAITTFRSGRRMRKDRKRY